MSKPRQTRPPRFASALLGWLVADVWETPLGDFEEYLHLVAESQGLRRARWWYRSQVLRMLPDRLFAKLLWSLDMLKSYFLLAYRNLLRNPTASAINLVGLSVAVGCAIAVYLIVQHQMDTEYVHENGNTIFMVESLVDVDGQTETWGITPSPLGPALEAEVPGIIRTVRVVDAFGSVLRGNDAFSEHFRFVDPAFLESFTFPLKAGMPAALDDPTGAILSEEAAIHYFGDADPLGQSLDIVVDGQDEVAITVQGVAQPFSSTSDLGFSVLLPYERWLALDPTRDNDWSTLSGATFIQVIDPGAVAAIVGQMDPYISHQAVTNTDQSVTGLVLDNLHDLKRHSSDVEHTLISRIRWAGIIVFCSLAGFLLLLSSINYINISIATASRRLKEIGMRKVMGGRRQQLACQFLAENMVLCTLALLLGIVVAHVAIIPAFNYIAGANMNLATHSLDGLLLFLGCLLVGVGFISGAYPALYISSFQPIAIFAGIQKLGTRGRFMQSLLSFQFVVAMIMMIVCVGMVLNTYHQQALDWGYDPADILVVELQDSTQYAIVRNEALQLPNVAAVAGARHHIGRNSMHKKLEVDAHPVEAVVLDVGPNYPAAVGIQLKAGQFFEEAHVGVESQTLVVNEAFVASQEWADPLERSVRVDSTLYRVIGVVADFHYDTFSVPIEPMIFRLTNEASFRYLTVQLEAGAGRQTAVVIGEMWQEQWPDQGYEFFFQDSVFDSFFREIGSLVYVFGFVALLALLISCMGLFGLASQNTASRMKEISIRKVLGGSVGHLAHHLNRRFGGLLVIAALVATPVGYIVLDGLLDVIFAYRMRVGPSSFLLAYGLVFLTGLLTISTQIHQLATADPATTLRNE